MSQPTMWQRVKTGGKAGFDKAYKVVDKLGAPVNRVSNKLGSEAFWPTTLDKESDKAARILKTFCRDGFYTEEEHQPEDGPRQKQKVVKKIPTSVIKNAKGLAIFTTMRSGLWVSGAGGSGVLIARKEDGSWSPPSGIMLHTAGLGFLVGVDIYDCVIVINSDEALEAFTKVRCTLGSEISVSAGPVGAGGIVDTEVHKHQAPIFTYLKSRGFYAGVQLDGTVIIERNDENERFYGQNVAVKDILAGKSRHPPSEMRRLLETIKAAEGNIDVDETFLPTEAAPSDFEIDDGHVFSVPDKDDPDPYGVLALEKEGLSIKEAGTQKRASWEAFSFNPAPTSPVHHMHSRSSSIETPRSASARNSWRWSALSNESKTHSHMRTRSAEFSRALTKRRPTSQMSDSGTQTDDLAEPTSPPRGSGYSSPRHNRSISANLSSPQVMQGVPEDRVLNTSPEKRESEPDAVSQMNGYTTPPQTPPATEKQRESFHTPEDDDARIEEPVFQSAQTVSPAAAAQVISKARIVTVPKRKTPKLPPRNPNRSSGPVVIDASPRDRDTSRDVSQETSPVKSPEGESMHDSGLETSNEKDRDVDLAKEKLEGVHLDDGNDDDDDDDVMSENPWAKVEETRKRREGKQQEEEQQKEEEQQEEKEASTVAGSSR